MSSKQKITAPAPGVNIPRNYGSFPLHNLDSQCALSSQSAPGTSADVMGLIERKSSSDTTYRQEAAAERATASATESSPSHNDVDQTVPCFALSDPRSTSFRFIGIFFICFMNLGNFFTLDTPAALVSNIQKDMHVDNFQYQALNYIYNWPNVVLPVVGGVLIDSVLGLDLGSIIFSSFLVLGQIVFALGAFVNHYWLMLVGRFIFALGGEGLGIAGYNYLVMWLLGKEICLGFGFQNSVGRLGSFSNFLTMQLIYTSIATGMGVEGGHTVLGWTILASVGTLLFSFLCGIVLVLLNRKRDTALDAQVVAESDNIRLSDIRSFPLSFWLVCLNFVTFYAAVGSQISMCQVVFMQKFGMTAQAANTAASLPYLLSCVLSPFAGLAVDYFGRNAVFGLACSMAALLCHLVLAFTFVYPYFAMVVIGIALTMMDAAMWPVVALVLPVKQLGTGFGFVQGFSNLGWALVAMIVGYVADNYGYLMTHIVFLICLSIAVAACSVLILSDKIQTGGFLSKASKNRPIVSPSVAILEEKSRVQRGILPEVPGSNLQPRKSILAKGGSVASRKQSVVFTGVGPESSNGSNAGDPQDSKQIAAIFAGKVSVLAESSKEGSVESVFESGKRNDGFEEDSACSDPLHTKFD